MSPSVAIACRGQAIASSGVVTKIKQNGIPSLDTFARVFAKLDPEQLQQSTR
ncbi:MAG: transposase family protein [Xenococcaceae cyanobacterium]